MNGTASIPTTPQTSSTSQPAAYDAAEHALHLRNTYGIAAPLQEQPGELVMRTPSGIEWLLGPV